MHRKLIYGLLGASLLGNVFLGIWLFKNSSSAAQPIIVASTDRLDVRMSPKTEISGPNSGELDVLISDSSKHDIPQVVLEEAIRLQIYQEFETRKIELISDAISSVPWWRWASTRRDPLSVVDLAGRLELVKLESAARRAVISKLGAASLDRTGGIAYRYSFLDLEKAVLVYNIDRDYENLTRGYKESLHGVVTKSDRDTLTLITEAKEEELSKLLTNDEYARFINDRIKFQ